MILMRSESYFVSVKGNVHPWVFIVISLMLIKLENSTGYAILVTISLQSLTINILHVTECSVLHTILNKLIKVSRYHFLIRE